jgi:hypothetical protein
MITMARTGIAYDDSPHEDPNLRETPIVSSLRHFPFDFRTHVRLS